MIFEMIAGKLKHNSQGRYEIPGATYFTSGEAIELFLDEQWIKGRIEYSHKVEDYYFLNEDEGIYVYHLTGILARCI